MVRPRNAFAAANRPTAEPELVLSSTAHTRRLCRSGAAPSRRPRDAYRREMAAAKRTRSARQRWRHLERAHIVSQPDPWLHTCNHAAMLALALRHRDRREAFGQVVRLIVAAPGSLTVRYPGGNTDRVDAGLMTPMAAPADLAALVGGRRD